MPVIMHIISVHWHMSHACTMNFAVTFSTKGLIFSIRSNQCTDIKKWKRSRGRHFPKKSTPIPTENFGIEFYHPELRFPIRSQRLFWNPDPGIPIFGVPMPTPEENKRMIIFLSLILISISIDPRSPFPMKKLKIENETRISAMILFFKKLMREKHSSGAERLTFPESQRKIYEIIWIEK